MFLTNTHQIKYQLAAGVAKLPRSQNFSCDLQQVKSLKLLFLTPVISAT